MKSTILICLLLSIAVNANPSGTYYGTTSFLGVKASGEATFIDDQYVDLSLSTTGLVEITVVCTNERYVLNGADIVLLDIETPGNCLYEAIQENGVKVKQVTYSSASDQITLKVNYIVDLTIVMSKGSLLISVDSLQDLYALSDLSGNYYGNTNVLGTDVTAEVNFKETGADVAIKATGLINIDIQCNDERYQLSGETIELLDLNTAGNCLNDALNEYGVTVKSILYNSASDEIVFTVNALIDVTITLQKTSSFHILQYKEQIYTLSDLSGLSGTYLGSTNVLGTDVAAEVTFKDSDYADVAITATGLVEVSVTCSNERYSLNGSNIELLDINTPGSCLYDAVQDGGITVKSITYSNDRIVFVINKLIDITITMNKK